MFFNFVIIVRLYFDIGSPNVLNSLSLTYFFDKIVLCVQKIELHFCLSKSLNVKFSCASLVSLIFVRHNSRCHRNLRIVS